jgi:DNA-binding transcriptional LysR family regulator
VIRSRVSWGSNDSQEFSVELRHLRYFVAVAERKGFREASRFLHVSQPAISKSLTQLEQELGVKLFARSGRSVRLTPQGEVFYKETLLTLKQADHAAESAQRANRGEFGTLTLAFCGVATYGFLPRLVQQYKELQPGVRISLREMNPPQQELALLEGHIDAGITRLPFAKKLGSELEVRSILREPLVVAVSDAHRFAGRKVRVDHLSEEPFILLQRAGAPAIHDAVLGMCQKAGFVPKIASEADLMHTVFTLVAAGQGIALVPACVMNLRPPGVRFLRLQRDEYTADLVLAWRKDSQPSTLHTFVGLLERETRVIRGDARQLLELASGAKN